MNVMLLCTVFPSMTLFVGVTPAGADQVIATDRTSSFLYVQLRVTSSPLFTDVLMGCSVKPIRTFYVRCDGRLTYNCTTPDINLPSLCAFEVTIHKHNMRSVTAPQIATILHSVTIDSLALRFGILHIAGPVQLQSLHWGSFISFH